MENQYNYYTSDQNMNTENYSTGGNQDQGPKKKHGKGASRWAKVVCTGLVFGVVASAAFQTSNIVAGKVLGTTQTTNKTAKTTTTANVGTGLAKLNQKVVMIDTDIGLRNLDVVMGLENRIVYNLVDVTEVAKNAMPSIVSITNMSVQEVQNFFGGTQKQKSESAGSGIIVGQNDSELLIVTNNHVVEGSSTLTVTFIDEESVEADIKGTDSDKDLAVVAVPLSKIKDSTMNKIAVATLGDSDKTQVGDQVIAIGNALGYGQSVTTGIVSAKERTMDSYDGKLLQTDAAINPGNSGGALLNANGEVIGINSAKIATETVEGIGYAIPVSDVSDLITNLMNQKTKTKVAESERGYIGIKGVDVTSDSAQMYNMPTGVYVSEVISGGGAEKAGITKGAVITGIEGTTVDGMDALQEQLQYYKAGEKVKITVQTQSKNGEYEKKDVEVTLGKQSE